MSITITVPDSVASAAQREADARGATVEQYLLATLSERFDNDAFHADATAHASGSPLLRLIGLAKNGPPDSSVFHDHRPGDPV